MTTATLTEKDRIAKDRSDVLALIANMKKSHHDKNAAAFGDQFAQNAAIFNLAPPLIHHGVDIAEKKAWFESWEGPVEIDTRDFEVTVDGDHAFAHGYMHMSGTKKGPEGRVSFWMRETLCLERAGDGWKIVHEHTSVPFYMDGTLRPAFDLQP